VRQTNRDHDSVCGFKQQGNRLLFLLLLLGANVLASRKPVVLTSTPWLACKEPRNDRQHVGWWLGPGVLFMTQHIAPIASVSCSAVLLIMWDSNVTTNLPAQNIQHSLDSKQGLCLCLGHKHSRNTIGQLLLTGLYRSVTGNLYSLAMQKPYWVAEPVHWGESSTRPLEHWEQHACPCPWHSKQHCKHPSTCGTQWYGNESQVGGAEAKHLHV
jgi:hypothetical protein